MFVYIVAIIGFLLDQFSKCRVAEKMLVGQSSPGLGKFFSFTYVQNTGAVFGIGQKQTILFIIISLIAVLGIIIIEYRVKKRNNWVNLSLGLILGGAAGNLLDRIRLGYVIDFIDFHFWPVFNLADSFICIGVVLLLIYLLRSRKTV